MAAVLLFRHAQGPTRDARAFAAFFGAGPQGLAVVHTRHASGGPFDGDQAMESLWLSRAKRLQAIASTGLYFCKDEFDRERYQEVADIAHAMLADLANVPITRISGLVSDFARGYATPKVDVRGALIEGGKVLLVREKSDGRWTLPGGFADIGRSASENVVNEIHEEAGLQVSATHLYSVRHKAKAAYDPDARDFYKLFFLCERSGEMTMKAGIETSEVGFFAPADLPDLSRGRVLESDIRSAFAFQNGAQRFATFD
ncbi:MULTISPECIES: NUDIX hydrolase [Rhizobium]|uniref:ADP-ribose pyrophosphatase YjhB (NUDIX family) n=1 Tax=Rhizobium esperanzae TaxID=1967781 RepID=A0A7W6UMH2_9HYPH|nr:MULTISPECIES: NUDIX hydrolase [Rhizobium]MBB4440937.1 ADP-ribose pyrophosphatase YjhB (NUDIX family) [Rhizobium esperanzae]MDH6203859.1 ADP-ribose pyrophosphatase YjhB (NUDIX family) [Rhizobium leguminosarum]